MAAALPETAPQAGRQLGIALEIRMLGELELLRAGKAQPLPSSRKTRALLGYLVATHRPQLRERLCDLLWDGPDDPRAGLRWSLTKIRPLLDDTASRRRLTTEQDKVVFEPLEAEVDWWEVQSSLAKGVDAASTEALRATAARFRGEFLEGIDLPDCFRFHEWCVAQREAARRLRLSVLTTLVERCTADPEEALRYARDHVEVEPSSETAHVAVIQLLGRLGRTREANDQYDRCRHILEATLGVRPSAALEQARLGPRPASNVAAAARAPKAPAPGPAPSAFFGRERECSILSEQVAETAAGRSGQVLLVAGEPGIGKTRLLERLAWEVRAAGGTALIGRAYEAEAVRPYGAWIDALRSQSLDLLPEELRADVALLLPELGAPASDKGDRTCLFEAVQKLLLWRTEGDRPVVLILDDLQWADEASTALLHSAARGLSGSRVMLAIGARSAELGENPAALRLIGALRRDGRLRELVLEPLGGEAIAALARSVDPQADVARVFQESQGNPLFATEVARALGRRQPDDHEELKDLDGLIGERLSQLDARTRDLLPWAAALGHGFSTALLARTSGASLTLLFDVLSELELRGVLRSTRIGGEPGYDFAHDLVRGAAYRQLSEPRRALLHLQIAQTLSSMGNAEGARSGDVLHHAELAGEHGLAARAAVSAGERCLSLCAQEEGVAVAERGLVHAAHLPLAERLPLEVALLRVIIYGGRWAEDRHLLSDRLNRLVEECRQAGLGGPASGALVLVSLLSQYSNDLAKAETSIIEATEANRVGDSASFAASLANGGRCLAHLGREFDRAESMLREAEDLASHAGVALSEIPFGLGLIRHHDGDLVEATRQLERGLTMMRSSGEQWKACECMSHLVRIDLERGRLDVALQRSAEFRELADKMGEGSEAPFAFALQALAEWRSGDPGAEERVLASVTILRDLDSKSLLAEALALGGEIHLGAGRPAKAEPLLSEALGHAQAVQRRSDMVWILALLAEAALARRALREAERRLEQARGLLSTPREISARARTTLQRASRALEGFRDRPNQEAAS
jgi:DNA-binding SARP family transcriptional activator/tetratricopeptide (TPR) repeat protein